MTFTATTEKRVKPRTTVLLRTFRIPEFEWWAHWDQARESDGPKMRSLVWISPEWTTFDLLRTTPLHQWLNWLVDTG